MWSGFRMTGSNPDTDRIWTKNTSWAILILLTFPDPKCLSLSSSGQNQPRHISKAVIPLGRTKDHLALPAWGRTVSSYPRSAPSLNTLPADDSYAELSLQIMLFLQLNWLVFLTWDLNSHLLLFPKGNPSCFQSECFSNWPKSLRF